MWVLERVPIVRPTIEGVLPLLGPPLVNAPYSRDLRLHYTTGAAASLGLITLQLFNSLALLTLQQMGVKKHGARLHPITFVPTLGCSHADQVERSRCIDKARTL